MTEPFKWAIVLALLITGVQTSGKPGSETTSTTATSASRTIRCPNNDQQCEKDKLGFEAIRMLHAQIDDDKDGSVDLSESDEFIRDELKYEDGFERHSSFHGKDDSISKEELWSLWRKSEVYNWTVDDVLEWLVTSVELPQYAESFKINAVDGRSLPRIAVDMKYESTILGIKNQVHKQKLALKAMDVVLFGPPKRGHSYIKDLALVASLVIAVGGCWLAYMQHKYSQSHLKKVMKDLENLQKAEDALTSLQHKLDQAEQHQQLAQEEKQEIEKKMTTEIISAKSEAERLRYARETTEEEISRLRLAEEELVQVRKALKRAEKQLEDGQHIPLGELQPWLQVTYELESKHYEIKREAAERQLAIAKEMCEKIRKKRNAFLGSFRIAHTTSIDDTDHTIMSARAALEDIRNDLQERSHRWQQIEQLCGFSIVNNPGINNLLAGRTVGTPVVGQVSLDEADEDMPPNYMAATAAFYAQPQYRGSMNALSTLVPHGVDMRGLTPSRTEPMIWPNLMQAGMQLTMFGLGLASHRAMQNFTDKRLSGMGPGASLNSMLTTSTASLGHSHSCTTMAPANINPAASKSGASIRRQFEVGGLGESSAQLQDSGDEGSRSSTQSDKIIFDLDPNQSASHEDANMMTDDPTSRTSYNKSQSLDAERSRSRPRQLPTSISEPAIPALKANVTAGGTEQVKGRGVQKRVASATTTPVKEEESSSPESMDSFVLTEDHTNKETGKKKKKKKFFSKLLKKD